MDTLSNLASLRYFIPELILIAASLLLLILPLFKRFTAALFHGKFTLIALLFANGAVCLFQPQEEMRSLFFGLLVMDGFSWFFKIFFLLGTFVVVLLTMRGNEVEDFRKPEFYSILLVVVLGAFLTASSRDLLMMYLSIELLSIGSYVLAGFSRIRNASDEAAIKYILYGGLSTGAMVYGMIYLYGLTGSTDFVEIHQSLAQQSGNELVLFISFLLILVGIGYKVSMVPFHFWAPDVYQGSPTVLTAFLSVVSKGAGFAAFVRLFYTVFLIPHPDQTWTTLVKMDWRVILTVLAIVTMTYGNLGAFRQDNIKRLFAYSGIAHAGYILVGALALSTAGVQSILFYLLTYLFTNLAAFAVIIYMADWMGIEEVSGYSNLGRRSPLQALTLSIALFSLIGVPPMAGFLGKWYLFAAAVATQDPWCIAAVVAGLLNSVLSVYYYFRILKVMYLDKEREHPPLRLDPVANWAGVILAIPVVGILPFAGSLYDWTGKLTQLLLA